MIQVIIEQASRVPGGVFYFALDPRYINIKIEMELGLNPDEAFEQGAELLRMALECRKQEHHTKHLVDRDYPVLVDHCLDIAKHRKENVE